MSFSQLPLSALEHIQACLYDAEDSHALCGIGRWAIAIRLRAFLRKAKRVFWDLWARRDEQEWEEWDWSAGNSPRSSGYDPNGYWTDGSIDFND